METSQGAFAISPKQAAEDIIVEMLETIAQQTEWLTLSEHKEVAFHTSAWHGIVRSSMGHTTDALDALRSAVPKHKNVRKVLVSFLNRSKAGYTRMITLGPKAANYDRECLELTEDTIKTVEQVHKLMTGGIWTRF